MEDGSESPTTVGVVLFVVGSNPDCFPSPLLIAPCSLASFSKLYYSQLSVECVLKNSFVRDNTILKKINLQMLRITNPLVQLSDRLNVTLEDGIPAITKL